MKNAKKLPKFHYFNGKKYNFRWRKPRKAVGLCDAPIGTAEERFITVYPKQDDKEFVETLIHEALHAEQWYLDEETVTRIAANLTDLLDKCDLIKPRE